MGKRNKERRAAKAKARQRFRRASPRHECPECAFEQRLGSFPGPGGARTVEAIEFTLMLAANAVATGEHAAARDCAAGLAGPDSPIEARLLSRAATQYVHTTLGDFWRGGWQPSDLAAIVRRRRTQEHLDLAVRLIEEQARQYAAGTVHPRWRAQLADLGADPWPVGRNGAGEGVSRLDLGTRHDLQLALELVGLLMTLSDVQLLMPSPGTYRSTAASGAAPIDERALARVRALLAKAESSEFPDEAEALSAKAQQLMARHALTRIVVESRADRVQPVLGRRLWLDAPYAGAKSLLVSAVASANRCKAVWCEELGFSTVVGEEADLDGVELLSTSLLVQASRAMLGHGQQRNRYGESRTRSFRHAFLVAYATRIADRLRGATEAAVEETEDCDRLLPALRAQADRVDDAYRVLFPDSYQRTVNVTNAAGWSAGRAAADVALFDVAAAIPGSARPAASRVAAS